MYAANFTTDIETVYFSTLSTIFNPTEIGDVNGVVYISESNKLIFSFQCLKKIFYSSVIGQRKSRA